jgi:WD40 repeat protein
LLAACRPDVADAPTVAKRAPSKEAAKKEPQLTKLTQLAEPLVSLERKLTGHKDWVNAVAVSLDGKLLVSGAGTGHGVALGDECNVRIWDLDTGNSSVKLE